MNYEPVLNFLIKGGRFRVELELVEYTVYTHLWKIGEVRRLQEPAAAAVVDV